MKSFVVALALVAGAVAKPGGYTGYGGVYTGMNAAKQASKMAVDIFDDESLQGDIAQRAERNSPLYVPTFFTGVPQSEPHPVAAAHADSNRFQRDANTYQQQTFYREYRPSARAVY